MKSKDLLSQLTHLEATLSNFSFEELTSADATRLKKSFQSFKNSLEEKVLEHGLAVEKVDDRVAKEKLDTSKPDGKEAMLIATVSHEIRTPLNGIIGFTDLLRESELTQDQLQHVNAIQSASRSLMEIINELLEYSKLSSGLEHFESVHFNFYSIVRDVMYLCNTLIIGKDVKLEVDMDTNIPEILVGDPSKLSQVLLNLLGNSIKFVEKGDISLKINQIKDRQESVVLEFEVSDTGIGISENDLKHIFNSFKQADQHTFSKYGGSGLGLSIVKEIVEKLNGDIRVNSSLGVGTTFKFTLPYGKGKQEISTTSQNTSAEVGADQIKGLGILVFEDNLLNQRLIEQRLKSWGCRTYITENALYGLNILENNKIDIVLMDLRMPVMDGFEVTRHIRNSKNAYVKQVPIIALTADFTIKDKDQCNENGINDYILKPYSPNELLSKLIKNKNDMNTILAVESATINAEKSTDKVAPIIDLSHVLDECMGDVGLLEELVNLYKQNALEFIGQTKIHLKNSDFEGLQFATHKIKAGLAMMKTNSLHSIVLQMNSTTKTNKDIKHLKFLYNCFLEEYPLVEKAIDAALKEVRKG